MQLSTPRPPGDLTDLAAAVRDGAGRLGARPAITLLTPAGRQEQSFASLAQWTAKGAHWLALDQLLGPGDTLGILGPPGWVPAAAALAAWWAGVTVAVDRAATTADVVVAHASHAAELEVDVLTWGAGFDGAPTTPGPGEAYTHAVQAFPDQPPPPAAGPDVPALTDGRTTWTQARLLRAWVDAAAAPAGVHGAGAVGWLPAVAVRPLVTGRPTVVLGDGVPRDAAAGDRVAEWL